MTDAIPRPPLPTIIQGGMGIAVSSWRLARAVACRGQLGVVSGTAIDRVVAYRLQEGDQGGHIRRALAAFPVPAVAARVLAEWFRPDGLETPGVYKPVPMFGVNNGSRLLELTVVASFAEVWLAKEGHSGQIGMNLLEKIQLPTLPVLYGAMLAGIDVVLMGAGIPRDIPGHIAALAEHRPAALVVAVTGGERVTSPFDPAILGTTLPVLPKPRFLAIISSDVLAVSLARSGGVDGFVVEGPTAGGHNAPPRDKGVDANGEPLYGPRDKPDLERLRKLGLPFWLAGGCASPEQLVEAKAQGAQGIQVGTAFAFCEESGFTPDIRVATLAAVRAQQVSIRTDGRASPTGFPFKVATMPESEGGRSADERQRQACSFGYLRQAAQQGDAVIWRCPAEPVETFTNKGGDPADAVGRRCVCLGLFSAAGHALVNGDGFELPLITAGDDVVALARYLRPGRDGYTAAEVIDDLLGLSQAQ